ncbi:MAG TPA: hypothetical protein PK358_09340 [Spirochaetota bacterium]|nr:hypothetical protein [Spirochaetota bacterium]
MSFKFSTEKVLVNTIDNDDHFRISKNIITPELIASIENYGLLERPVLIRRGERCYPFTGHNRIKVISGTDAKEIDVFILESPSSELFFRNTILKVYRKECGPVGRLKAVKIMHDDFGLAGSELSDFARKRLKIPNEFISDSGAAESVLSFPPALKDYIDQKDITYKIIRDIISSGNEVIAVLNKWLEQTPIRVNIFKMLVDYLFDIVKRDGGLVKAGCDDFSFIDDKELHDFIFRVRYPEYASKREYAEKIISTIEKHGVSVDFPEYFEKDKILLRFNITKKDGGSKLAELVSELNMESIDELFELL